MKRKNNLVGHCGYCFAPLKGRSDKRFCSLNCKNYYHQTVREFQKDYSIPDVEINFFVLCTAYYKRENKHPLDPIVMSKYDWYENISIKAREYTWSFGPAYFHIFTLRFNPNNEEGIKVELSHEPINLKNANRIALSDYILKKILHSAQTG